MKLIFYHFYMQNENLPFKAVLNAYVFFNTNLVYR